MFTFRTSITFAVMAFILALAALLIAIQVRVLHWATQEAAAAYMDATSTKAFGRLQTEITAMTSLVRVLATSSSVADSNERTETGPAIALFKAALQELPQMDSIYAGFENGAWLQVRRTSDLNEEQREYLHLAKASADALLSVINDVLDFSKMEAQKFHLDVSDFRKLGTSACACMSIKPKHAICHTG